MDRRINSENELELIGSHEHTSWLYHYQSFCHPDKTFVLLLIEQGMFALSPKQYALDLGWTVFHEPKPLYELQKEFSTSIFEEVNWSGFKHEFWERLLGRIRGMDHTFMSFLVQSRFPIHKAIQYLEGKNQNHEKER